MAPSGWRDLYLNEFAKIIVSPVDKKSFESETPVELCNYTDVYYNERITRSISFMKATAKKSEIEKYTLEVDDVIITKDSETPGDIAVPALIAEDLNGVVCGYHLAIVRTNKNLAIGSFINYLFSMPRTRYYFFTLATGATRFGLSIGGINKAHFRLPTLPEQHKIAKILSTWDKAISTTERLIDNTKQQKKALMQQLLTGKKRLLGDSSKQFEGDYNRVNLSELAKIDKSSLGKKTPEDFEFSYISLSDVETGKIAGNLEKHFFASSPSRARRKVSCGDTLLATVRPNLKGFAKVKAEHDGMIASTGFSVLTPKKDVSGDYLYHYLFSCHITGQINALVVGSNYPAINASDVSGLKVYIPCYDEQKKVAKVLNNADESLAQLEQQLADLKQEKKALMQQLLTGKKRVII